MKKQSYSFPSVYEAIGTNLSFVSKDLINGLQLYDTKEQAYMIGNLALTEGISPNKLVNSSPYEIDYQLLLNAGLLLANHNNNRPLALTTGFPFSTYQVYKDIAKDHILNLDTISYNPGTYTKNDKANIKANIKEVEILPEMIGNIIALRVGKTQAEGNFFVVSLGYGTCEAVLSTESGIVHRTALSINGMQYAVDLFMRSLATKYYLGLKTEKQLDVSFRSDHIILDRQKINIVELRKRILERYYNDIISAGLRKSFSDSDFERADKIYLTGGGALFPELVERFEDEFKQIAHVEVVKNPLTLTSEGYSLNSIMLTGGDESTAIGLDVGNANTVLTQYENKNIVNTPETVEKVDVKEAPEVIKEKEEVIEKPDKKETEKPITKKVIKEEPKKEIKEKISPLEEELKKLAEKEAGTVADVEKEEFIEEKKGDGEKLAELSEEEKNMLTREAKRKSVLEKKKDGKIEDKEESKDSEKTSGKGNLENYEPDFS